MEGPFQRRIKRLFWSGDGFKPAVHNRVMREKACAVPKGRGEGALQSFPNEARVGNVTLLRARLQCGQQAAGRIQR